MDNNEIELVVDGQTIKMTLDELKSKGQKLLAGEKRMEEAAALKKEAEAFLSENKEKLKTWDLMQAVRNGDPDANREMAKAILGVDDSGLTDYIDNIQQQFSANVQENYEGREQTMEIPDNVKRTLQAFEQFAEPLVRQGYSLKQVGEILSTGITKQAGANRASMLRQAAEKSDTLKSMLKKDPERVERLIKGFANERQGGGQLTDAIIQLAVQDTEKVLGGLTVSEPKSQPDIALGELGATLDSGYSRTQKQNMPNMYDKREESNNAMTKLLVDLVKSGGEDSAEA